MKKSMLMLSAMLGCVLAFAADPVKPAQPAQPAKPAVPPAQPAQPAAKPEMKSITLEELTAGLPNVLAKMSGKEITKAQFIKDFLAPQLPGGKLPPMPAEQAQTQISQFTTMMAPMLVKGYVDQLLVEEAAAKAGFKPSAELVTNLLKAQFAKLPAQQKEMLKMQLQIQNKTEESYIKEQSAKPEIQKMAAIQQYLDKEIAGKIKVDDAAAKAYYDKNIKRFTEPADAKDAIRASHILIGVKEGAKAEEQAAAKAKTEALIAELKKAPNTFAAVAARESACPSKAEGGSLGAFRTGEMVPEFEKAAGALKIGEMTAVPVKTSYGYHIIRREALRGETVIPFEKVKPMIVNMLKGQQSQETMEKLIAQLETAAKVEYMIKPAAPAPAAPIPVK